MQKFMNASKNAHAVATMETYNKIIASKGKKE